MGAEAKDLRRALEALRDELGPDAVLDQAAAAQAVEQRTLNPATDVAPSHLLRPRSTEHCRAMVERLSPAGCFPIPIGSLTTFWEPREIGRRVAIDTLELRTPLSVDPAERIGYFGAGVTVREADRLARSHGLCLPAYPDSDGSQSLGSMAAIGCTTGLGLGRIEPVEQIAGLTVVTREAKVVKTGAAWRRGRGGVANGEPDPAGIFLGSQGHAGLITEVVVKLWPAPFLAARAWAAPWLPAADLVRQLRRARHCFDSGALDSLRLETVCAGDAQPRDTQWYARCWSPESARRADQHCDAVTTQLGVRSAGAWVESDAARRGELPDFDQRYSVPPGQHRARTGQDGFLGIEVNVNWGEQLDTAALLFAKLFDALAPLRLGHRRLGIYPSPHAVSIGLQTMLAGGSATPDAVREKLAEIVEPLGVLGAVPYRDGRLWRPLAQRREAEDPARAIVRRAANAEHGA
jgi:FAD/FMN-containing dehydrogenase